MIFFEEYYRYMMWHYGFGWDFFPGGIIWVLFWVLIASLFWGRWSHGERHHDHEHDHEDRTAEDILDERFAKGEIDEKEYEHRLTTLRKHAN